jgi:uncharacterized membrane protein YdbT with pleckstrin-like domain
MEKETIEYLRPSLAYLEYRKFFFWIGLAVVDLFLIALWLAMLAAMPLWGVLTAPLWLFVIVAPDIIAYIALHLAYDTTWYVLSDRSMRIRRGIWKIDETTITFENIQNINIVQGPLQRWFGFANLMVSTAGGGSATPHGSATSHLGLLEGIGDAAELRERILAKSKSSTGLGDEEHLVPTDGTALSFRANQEQLALLREIHALTGRL